MNKPTIEVIQLDDLVEREKNPNKMPKAHFELLVLAMRQLGTCLQPVLVRPIDDPVGAADGRQKYEIIDGAHRGRAAREAGLESIHAVVAHTDDELSAALQLGMNRLRGEIDLALAAEDLGALVAAGWHAVAGFELDEAAALVSTLKEPNPDDVFGGSDASLPTAETDPAPAGELTLEVTGFVDVKELRKVKRVLRKAGGGDLRRGLLKMIGEET